MRGAVRIRSSRLSWEARKDWSHCAPPPATSSQTAEEPRSTASWGGLQREWI